MKSERPANSVRTGMRVPRNMGDYIEGGDTLDDFRDGFPAVTQALALEALEEAKRLSLAHG